MRGPLQLYDQHGRLLNVNQAWPAASRGSKLFDNTRDRGGLAVEQDTFDLPTLRQRSASLVRSGGIANALIGTMLSGVVGVGLETMPELDPGRLGMAPAQADELEERIRAEWASYSVGLNYALPDQPFAEYLVDITREALEFGDCFAVLIREQGRSPYQTRTQLVESVRVANAHRGTESSTHNNGIHFDSAGRPTAYDIASTDPAWTGSIDWTTVSREHVLHVKLPRQRLGGPRGVPWLSPVLGAIQSLSEYSNNELLASWIQALFVLAHKSESYHTDDVTQQDSLESGTIFKMRPEESLEPIDATKPGRTFADFYFSQFKTLCASVGLPFEVVLKHFQSSYSASRGALIVAESTFRLYRHWLVNAVCRPLYARFIREALALGRLTPLPTNSATLRDPAALTRASWLGTPAEALDLHRTGQGLQAIDGLGLLSKRRLAAQYFGVDYRRMQRERAQEAITTSGGNNTP